MQISAGRFGYHMSINLKFLCLLCTFELKLKSVNDLKSHWKKLKFKDNIQCSINNWLEKWCPFLLFVYLKYK